MSAGTDGSAPGRALLARAGVVLLLAGLATVAAVVWVATAPQVTGRVVGGVVRYPGAQDPRAVVQAAYIAITAVAGLLTGTVALGLGDRGLKGRCLALILAALPLAGLTSLVGFVLGPATEATQLAAGADRIELPFVLSTPLLVLVWPAVTSLVVAVGMLLSLIIRPPGR